MIFTILSHQWKSFWRGRNVGKSVAMQLFVGFILLYLLFSFLLLGIFLHGILVKAFPGQDVIRVLCGFPHFLLNTLNFLYSRARPHSPELAEGILVLSEIMGGATVLERLKGRIIQ